jgi:hypothetical protein
MMSTNALSTLAKVFYEPKSAFESLKENSKPWLPLLLIMGSTLAIFYWYYATVDFAWLRDHTLSAKPDMKPDEREMVMSMLTKDRMMMTTLGGALIGMPIAFALYALYYLLASKVMGSAISYGKWFSFAVWVSVPALIGVPLMAMQIVTGHGQVSMEGLNLLSLNFLIAHLPADHAWAGLMNSLSLTTFWTMFLTFVGFRVWTDRSAVSCAIATAIPFAVIYGIWIAILVFFK